MKKPAKMDGMEEDPKGRLKGPFFVFGGPTAVSFRECFAPWQLLTTSWGSGFSQIFGVEKHL